MIIGEAADKVLSWLEQTDEEEYDRPKAIEHVNQAIFELAGDSELSLYNKISSYVLSDAPTDQDYWTICPGRVALTRVVGATWGEFGYIKKIWLDINGTQQTKDDWSQKRVVELFDLWGDTYSTPRNWGVEGEYMYWRPIINDTSTYTLRVLWSAKPTSYGEGEEPAIMGQAPYAVIYRACALGALWTQDPTQDAKFMALSKQAFDQYLVQDSMHGDGPEEMDDYNG